MKNLIFYTILGVYAYNNNINKKNPKNNNHNNTIVT